MWGLATSSPWTNFDLMICSVYPYIYLAIIRLFYVEILSILCRKRMKENWSADTVRIVYITINIWQPLTCHHGHIFGVENSCETELEVALKKKKFRLPS